MVQEVRRGVGGVRVRRTRALLSVDNITAQGSYIGSEFQDVPNQSILVNVGFSTPDRMGMVQSSLLGIWISNSIALPLRAPDRCSLGARR
eukprot:2233512-Pyramimonas_sp.AAC.1